jgi:uncharacterized protein (TIGR04255 family)
MTWQILSKPPIKEAVLDLKFKEGHNLTHEKIKIFCESLKETFPVINEMFLFQMQAKLEKGEHQNVESSRQNNGFKLSDEKRSFILQFRLDGFTLSKIEPYISWDELAKEARPLLEKMSTVFPEIRFNRAALRYINNFNLKFEEPINAYLNIAPAYPLELPQTVDSFLVRLAIPKREPIELKSIIHLGIDPIGNSDENYKVVFDIDVFRENEYSISDLDHIFQDFEYIREFKNVIFFNGLTKLTLDSFN